MYSVEHFSAHLFKLAEYPMLFILVHGNNWHILGVNKDVLSE